MSIILLILLAFVVYKFFFAEAKDPQASILKSAEDNTCRPHEWRRVDGIIDPALALELDVLLKQSEGKFEGSPVEAFTKGLTCKKCGYISGTNLMIDLEKWEEVVRNFLLVEKKKLGWIKNDEKI